MILWKLFWSFLSWKMYYINVWSWGLKNCRMALIYLKVHLKRQSKTVKLQKLHLSCPTTCQNDLSSPSNKILDYAMVRNFASCRQTGENPKEQALKNNGHSLMHCSQGTQVEGTEKVRIKGTKISALFKKCKYFKKANEILCRFPVIQ